MNSFSVRFRRAAVVRACAVACAAGFVVMSGAPVSAQLSKADGGETGVVWQGAPAVVETIEQIMAREAAVQRTAGPPAPVTIPLRRVDLSKRVPNPESPAVAQWPPAAPGDGEEPLPDSAPTPRDSQTILSQFNGVILSEAGAFPPDTMGAVGPTQVLFTVNGRIKVFSKAGVLGSLNVGLGTFFSSVSGGAGTSDVRCRYDRNTQRWFISCITTNTPNRVMLAVSSGPTLVNTASFSFYFFVQDQVGTTPNSDTGGLFDYPSLGVDPNAVLIGGNVFGGGTPSVFVIRKSSVLSGGPIVVTAFRNLASGGPGPASPQGVQNDDATATQSYFIGQDRAMLGRLTIRRITDPGGTPSISGNIFVTVPSTASPLDPPALGSSSPIDTADDRLINAVMRFSPITGITTLWTSHTIQVNSSGVASGAGGRDGGRWYQIRDMTTTPTLLQSGTLFDSAASNPRSYIFPCVTMSGQGHMALGATFCGAADRLGIATAGHYQSDGLGVTQPAMTAIAGVASYNAGLQNGSYRWGDYTETVVDPEDDMTMWTFQEFCNASNSWAVRVVQLAAPPPVTPTLAMPSSTLHRNDVGVNVMLSGPVPNGAGFFEPGPSYSHHIQASVSGGDITVNSVTVTAQNSVTLNLTVANNAALGPRTVTITNPDGQFSTSASGLLTVAAQSCTGDLNGDGQVGAADLGILLGSWGPCPAPPAICASDFDNDGMVGGADLAILLGSWGACP